MFAKRPKNPSLDESVLIAKSYCWSLTMVSIDEDYATKKCEEKV